MAHLLLEDMVHRSQVALVGKGGGPVQVLGDGFLLVRGQRGDNGAPLRHILVGQDEVRQMFQLCLQSCRKDGQSHQLNQSDVFLFYVVQLCMGMKYAHGMLFRGDVVSQG